MMQSNMRTLSMAKLTLLALCCSQESLAGGLMLYEIATDNTGLANAGAAARAQGPSTIASNPAGMSFLDGTRVSAGAQVLFGDLTFDRDAATTTPGTGSGNVLDPIPGPSFFISHRLVTARWIFLLLLWPLLLQALDEAKGWTVVDMAKDWSRIYPFDAAMAKQ